MDVWREDDDDSVRPPGSPPPASVLTCFQYRTTQCDVQHVDRGQGCPLVTPHVLIVPLSHLIVPLLGRCRLTPGFHS